MLSVVYGLLFSLQIAEHTSEYFDVFKLLNTQVTILMLAWSTVVCRPIAVLQGPHLVLSVLCYNPAGSLGGRSSFYCGIFLQILTGHSAYQGWQIEEWKSVVLISG